MVSVFEQVAEMYRKSHTKFRSLCGNFGGVRGVKFVILSQGQFDTLRCATEILDSTLIRVEIDLKSEH